MLKGIGLLVIGVIAIGGIWLLVTQVSTQSYSAPSAPAGPKVEEPKADPKTAPAVTKRVSKAEPPAQPPVVEQVAVVQAAPTPEVPSAIPVVQPDPPPFPAVGQIAAGVHEDSITGKFGDPALSAVTSNGGHMVETFVYARDGGRSATIIRLQDGKVSAAYSQSEAASPAGSPAPRRWRNE